jgi:ABC-2 type transport system permease protein
LPVAIRASRLNCNAKQRIGLSPDEMLNNSIQNLEYAFTSAIKKATSGGKQRIGFTEGHNELSDLQLE